LKFYHKRVQNSDFLKLEYFHQQIWQKKDITYFWCKSKPNSTCVKILGQYLWVDPGTFNIPILFYFFVSPQLCLMCKSIKHYSDSGSKKLTQLSQVQEENWIIIQSVIVWPRSKVGKVQLQSCMWLFGSLNAALAQISTEGTIIFSKKKDLVRKKLHLILIN